MVACDESGDEEEENPQEHVNSLESTKSFNDIRPINDCSIDDRLNSSEKVSENLNMCSKCFSVWSVRFIHDKNIGNFH